MSETKMCPLCGGDADVRTWTPAYDEKGRLRYSDELVNCEGCGHYSIAGDFGASLYTASKGGDFVPLLDVEKAKKYIGRRHLFSGLTRAFWDRQGRELRLSFENVDQLLGSAQVPKTPAQCVDRLLVCLKSKSSQYGLEVRFEPAKDWTLAYARSPDEFAAFLRQTYADDYASEMVTDMDGPAVRLATCVLEMKGWRRAEELEQTTAHSKQAFVATWFDEQMNEAYECGILPALEETGWESLWLKLTKDCGKIDDQITAGIMQSGLMIADFTGHRPSVYFEAGLAKGLGIPTILMCKEDEKDSENAGFDVEHYRHIYWTEPAQLKRKLVDFIGAMGLDRAKPLPPGLRASGPRPQ